MAVFVHCIKIKQSFFHSLCFKIQWNKETTSILLAVSEWKCTYFNRSSMVVLSINLAVSHFYLKYIKLTLIKMNFMQLITKTYLDELKQCKKISYHDLLIISIFTVNIYTIFLSINYIESKLPVLTQYLLKIQFWKKCPVSYLLTRLSVEFGSDSRSSTTVNQIRGFLEDEGNRRGEAFQHFL